MRPVSLWRKATFPKMFYGHFFLVTREENPPNCSCNFLTVRSNIQYVLLFEGDKENYECIKEVFDPVIEATQNVLAKVSELNLKVDLPKCASTCTKGNENQVFEIKGMQNWPMKLRQLIWNPQSDHCSENCLYCKKLTGPTCEISTLPSGDGTEMECRISKCWQSLGRDWEFLARLLARSNRSKRHLLLQLLSYHNQRSSEGQATHTRAFE